MHSCQLGEKRGLNFRCDCSQHEKMKYCFKTECEGFIRVSKHEKTDRARGCKPSVFTVFECLETLTHMHVTKLACLGWMITLRIINEFEEKQSNVESFLSVHF